MIKILSTLKPAFRLAQDSTTSFYYFFAGAASSILNLFLNICLKNITMKEKHKEVKMKIDLAMGKTQRTKKQAAGKKII